MLPDTYGKNIYRRILDGRIGMKRKFTLVELLTVTAVIGILATMIIPSLNDAVRRVKQVDCMNNLRQISIGYNLYRKDNRKYPQNEYFLDDFTPVYQYVNSTDVFNCKGENDYNVTETSQVDGQTPYVRHIDLSDLKDWERFKDSFAIATTTKGKGNNGGLGNNVYGLDPSNPNFPKWIAGKLKIEGLHDKDISYHGVYNFIRMDSGAYMPVYTKELLWELKENRNLSLN